MTSEMTNEATTASRATVDREVRATARRRVGNRIGLMWHGTVYAMVNVAMLSINLAYTPDTFWFVWPAAAWGAALLLHAFAALQVDGIGERMVQQEVGRELARRGLS